MEYSKFYSNAKRRTKEALLSIWAAGKKDTQRYLEQIFEEEPIFAEPVFQSMFPWESDNKTFAEFTDVFDNQFIHALSEVNDEKFRFPLDRKPYTHQANSWHHLLENNKSIVVTSGTGSGKTECFMLPIIQDLCRQKKEEYGLDKRGGIQAIFLYPLNALMSSQQKRMSSWCKAVTPQVSFAMYKGDTEENYKSAMKSSLPELKSREQIRNNPPQILFTNPTMLEYMLVRKHDKPILNTSREKKSLRWIVLDEAHTYSGSSAAELALQIRRILDAFGVTIEEVRFAATSATLGTGSIEEYKSFLSQVTGKSYDDIEVIQGNQILPTISDENLNSAISEINREFNGRFLLNRNDVISVRQELITTTLSAKEITNRFVRQENISLEDRLQLIDRLSQKNPALISDIDIRGALLPTRAHFFARNMGGLYACVNPECTKHHDIRIPLGSLTTIAQTNCNTCGSKLLEVNRCNACGNLLLVGQEQNGYYGFAKKESQSLFEIEHNDDSNDIGTASNESDNSVSFVLARGVTEKPINRSSLTGKILNSQEGKIETSDSDRDFVICQNEKGAIICPHCAESTDKLQPMYTGNLFSRLLAPTLLEQTAAETNDVNALWHGRKYISFTDNRQGTAKSSFQQNIEVERNWIRSAIYHYLSNERRLTIVPPQNLSVEEEAELNAIRQFNPASPRVIELERKKNGTNEALNPYKTYSNFDKAINVDSELSKLYNHLPNSFKTGSDESIYLQQLIIDQFGRRPRKAGINNPETMGLVRVVYPSIETSQMPGAIRQIFNELGWIEQDWKDFIKVTLDYFIRDNRYIEVPQASKSFKTQAFVNNFVYSPNSEEDKKFPVLNLTLDRRVKNPNRLVVLLLLAMGINREEQISELQEAYINQILNAAWNFLKEYILTPNNEAIPGYKLNMLGEKVAYQIIDKAWICPVNQVPLDTIFRGYSPLITSRISSNLENYRINEPPVSYRYFPFAYRRNNEHNSVSENEIIDWINTNMNTIREAGLWSNMHERILLNNPVYLAAEHTAQQNKQTLRIIEDDFENHKLNILSCSTTMEMGVDISGISEVVMNNVPPKPANYLQRAGRAGRGSETKALALTFCAPNPIGINLFNNQKWAMTHRTAVPKVSFDSNMLVQRHINSVLLSSYIKTDGHNNLTVSSSVEKFFYPLDGFINHFESFRTFLNEIILNGDEELNQRYIALVRNTCKQAVTLTDSVSSCLSSIESIFGKLEDKKRMLDDKISALLANNYNEDSPATKAIRSQLNHILSQNILGFFAENNFIPSAGIPTGVVEFEKFNKTDLKANQNEADGTEYNFGYQKANPSMLLTQAISEYAPGNQIILNEACYVSRGIVMKSQWNDTRRVIFQYCSNCGYAISKEGERIENCPHCNSVMYGINGADFTPLIEPAGFRVDFSEEPTRTIVNRAAKNYTQPELLNMPPWEVQAGLSVAKLELRHSNESNAEILYYNKGYGNGYAVCLECGKAVADTDEQDYDVAIDLLGLKDHKPIIGGKKATKDKELCSNNNIKRNVLLGGRFQTDFVEIRFRNSNGLIINDEETIFSLGVILTQKLAEKIGINSQEISFGIKKHQNYTSVFIYDTAKGGAGYSIRFNELKEDVFEMSRLALTCNCERACNSCLINRESQWSIDKLDRKKGLKWLDLEIASRIEVPVHIQDTFENQVYALTSNISSELNKILVNPDLSKVTFFIDNQIDNWKPETWEYYNIAKRLRQQGVTINFSFNETTETINNLSASQLSVLAEMRMSFDLTNYSGNLTGLSCLVFAEFSGNRNSVLIFSKLNETVSSFDSSWSNGNSFIYKVNMNQNPFNFTPWTPNFDFIFEDNNYIMFDFKITDNRLTSRHLLNKILNYQGEKWLRIKENVLNSSVKISYTDIYLKSPLSCRILIDFVSSIITFSNLSVESLNLFLADVRNGRDNDFYNTHERDKYLKEYAENFNIPVNVNSQGLLPHYRELKIENAQYEFIIRPDGGFENGWVVDYTNRNSGWEEDFASDIRLYNKSVDGILYTVAYKQKNNY